MKKLYGVCTLTAALIAASLLLGNSQQVLAAPTGVEVNASHVAYMSHPKETVKLIEEAATSAHLN